MDSSVSRNNLQLETVTHHSDQNKTQVEIETYAKCPLLNNVNVLTNVSIGNIFASCSHNFLM